MARRLPFRYWTAYRKFLVETLLDRGESRARIAGKLGIERSQVQSAIQHYDLRPRPLLKRMLDRGESLMSGLTCEGCGDVVDGAAPGYPRHCEDCRTELETCARSRLEPVHG